MFPRFVQANQPLDGPTETIRLNRLEQDDSIGPSASAFGSAGVPTAGFVRGILLNETGSHDFETKKRQFIKSGPSAVAKKGYFVGMGGPSLYVKYGWMAWRWGAMAERILLARWLPWSGSSFESERVFFFYAIISTLNFDVMFERILCLYV